MKKSIMFGFGIVFLLIGIINVTAVTTTYWCGDGICEADYCPGDCVDFLSTYCGDLIEPYECDDICGSELGWIKPPDCLDYGYYENCDSCCSYDGVIDSRAEIQDFCIGYGYIREDDCPECTNEDCIGLGYINPDDCVTGSSSSISIEDEEDCLEYGFIPKKDCEDYLSDVSIKLLCNSKGYTTPTANGDVGACCLFGICWFSYIFCWYHWILYIVLTTTIIYLLIDRKKSGKKKKKRKI